MKIKKILLSKYDRLVYLKRDVYDYLTRKEVKVSLGDLIQDQSVSDGTLLIVASRLMDVEAFVNNHDEKFFWQKKLSGIKYYNDEEWVALFKSIIKSYQEKGYNGKSHFLLDRNQMLRNGTHRTALHLFYKIYTAKAYVVKRQYPLFDELYDKYQRDLQLSTVSALESKLKKIRQQLINDGVSFCAVIPKDASLDGIVPSISSFVHIKKELGLSKLPKEISDSLKLNTTINYKLVLLTLDAPQYEVVSGLLESKKIKNVGIPEGCYVCKSCYEGKIIYDRLTPYFRPNNVNI